MATKNTVTGFKQRNIFSDGCHPAGKFAATVNRIGNITEPENLRRTVFCMDEGLQCAKCEKEGD